MQAWLEELLNQTRPLTDADLKEFPADPEARVLVSYKRHFDSPPELILKALAERIAVRGREAPPLYEPIALPSIPRHQWTPVTQSTAFTSRGQLLFDEVGLGRTIEAGLILSRELRRRRTPTSHSARRKALIIVPSALHEQWKSELHHKFGLDAEIFSPGYSRQRENQSGIEEGECWERTRFFVLMAYAGLRPNEVRALVGRDIRWNGDTGTILVRHGLSAGVLASPKTGPRKVPILGPLARELKSPPPASEHVATTAAGQPWSEWAPNQAFKRVCQRLSLPAEYTIYSLRHWAISSWLRAGIPVHVVQRMAGHKHLSTTQRYVHFIDADLDAAVAIYGNYRAAAAE